MRDPELLTDVTRWLQYAEEDLFAATEMQQHPAYSPRLIGFLAQQAAEKLMKAVILYLEIEPPRTHDLARLRQFIPAGWQLAEQPMDLSRLTDLSVESRYPGDWPAITAEDAWIALDLAKRVKALAWADLRAHGYPE